MKLQVILLALCFFVGFSVAADFIRTFESDQVSVSRLYYETERRNASSSARGRTCYGDITGLSPTGKATGGVPASQSEVRVDTHELTKRKQYYEDVADENCIQASLIAALASRESRGGALLYRTNGYGDHGRAYGILQCDLKHSGLNCLQYLWYTKEHIEMMVSKLLVPYIKAIHRKFPQWSKAQALQGAVAAYNKGVGRVKSWEAVDAGTTGGDYSNDVIARAQYLYQQGWN